jgi:signal transduction histidine kinase
MISVSSKLLLTLVNDLLDYSKMLAGVFSVVKTNFELKSIIESACELIAIQAKKKGLRLTIRIDPTLPYSISSDPLRMSQVILNLLSNALKFTLKG